MDGFLDSLAPPVHPAELSLYELLLVDDELELQAKPLGGLAAQDHALYENFEEFPTPLAQLPGR